MKYKTSYIIIGILVLLLMYLSIFCKPNINFSTKINTISTQDYQNILNSNQIIVEENKDIDKFKYLSVNVKIKASKIKDTKAVFYVNIFFNKNRIPSQKIKIF